MFIKLRFSGNWGMGGHLVALRTGSKWTHVDVVLDRGYLSAMPFKGVRIFDTNYLNAKSSETITVQCDDNTLTKLYSKINQKYGWHVWLYYIIGIKVKPCGWTCSGLLSTILGVGDEYTTPSELYRIVK